MAPFFNHVARPQRDNTPAQRITPIDGPPTDVLARARHGAAAAFNWAPPGISGGITSPPAEPSTPQSRAHGSRGAFSSYRIPRISPSVIVEPIGAHDFPVAAPASAGNTSAVRNLSSSFNAQRAQGFRSTGWSQGPSRSCQGARHIARRSSGRMHWATKGKNPVQMVYEYCSTNHLPKPLFEDAGVQNGNLFRFNLTVHKDATQQRQFYSTAFVNKHAAKRDAAVRALGWLLPHYRPQ